MKKLASTLAALGLTLSAFGQSTNLTANMKVVFDNLNPAVQASTLQCLLDYNKACRKSTEFAGITTNTFPIVIYTNGVPTETNMVTTVTTNHVTMSLTEWLQAALAAEKVSRIVEQRNQNLRQEIIIAVGTDVINRWGN